jgi:hypothetical protein
MALSRRRPARPLVVAASACRRDRRAARGGGVMAALVDEDGALLAANKPFADRAIGPDPVEQGCASPTWSTTATTACPPVAEGDTGRGMRAVSMSRSTRWRRAARHRADGLASSTNVQACSKCCRSAWRWSTATAAS